MEPTEPEEVVLPTTDETPVDEVPAELEGVEEDEDDDQ